MKNNFQKIKNLRADDPDLSDEYFKPSERVWTHVSQNLPTKNRRNLPFWIIPIMVGILALGYYSHWSLNTAGALFSNSAFESTKNTESSISSSKVASAEVAKEPNAIASSKAPEGELISNSILNSKEMGSNKLASPVSNEILQSKKGRFLQSKSIIENHLGSAERNEDPTINSSQTSSTRIESLTAIPTMLNRSVEPQTKTKITPLSLQRVEGEPIQITPPLRPSFALARVSFTNGARPDYDQGMHHMVETSKYAHSFGAHLGYEFSVSDHLSVRAGATFRRSALFTAYNLWMPYDLSNEELTHTGLHNTFEQELPSIDGDLITQMATVRGFGKEIAHNEPINFDLHAEIRSAHIAIPISLNYFFNPNRTGFFVGLGVSPGWLFDRSVHLLAAKSNHIGLSEERAQLGIRSVRPLFKFAGQALVGYRHSIGGRWYLDGQIQFTSNQNKLGVTRMVTGMFGVSMML